MNHIRIMEPRIYGLEYNELPIDSYILTNNQEDCMLVPFILGGDGDCTINQNNWTNMYLMKQLGSYINRNIEDSLKVFSIEQIMEKLPEDQRLILEKENPKDRIRRLIELSKPIEQKIYEIKNELLEIKNNLNKIMKVLGINNIIEPIKEKDQIKMLFLQLVEICHISPQL